MFFSRLFDHFFNRKFRNNRAVVRDLAPEIQAWAKALHVAGVSLCRSDRDECGFVESELVAMKPAPFPGMPPRYQLSGYVSYGGKIGGISLYDQQESVHLKIGILGDDTIYLDVRCPVVVSWSFVIYVSGGLFAKRIAINEISVHHHTQGKIQYVHLTPTEIVLDTEEGSQYIDLAPWILITRDTQLRLEYLLAYPSKGDRR